LRKKPEKFGKWKVVCENSRKVEPERGRIGYMPGEGVEKFCRGKKSFPENQKKE